MKYLLLGWALLIGTFAARAQAPTWQMALGLGGGWYSEVTATATDATGNVYLAGWFSNSSLVLGSITLTNAVTSGSSVGFSKDIFVAKWSPVTQDFVWAQRAGGSTDGDQATALTVRGGAVYVATHLVNASTGLGGGPAANGYYLTKLTDTGALVWTQPVGGPAAALAINGNSLYAAGAFAGTASFGQISITSLSNNDLYVAKLTDMGPGSEYVWVQQGNYTLASSLAVNGSNVYLSGAHYNSTALGNVQLPGQGAFVAKLVDAGATSSFSWVLPISSGGTALLSAGVSGLASAASGNKLYAVGAFAGTMTLGSATLTSLGYQDLFVAQLIDAGPAASIGWVRQAGSAGNSSAGNAIAVSGSSIYLAGTSNGTFSFDGNSASASAGGVVVAKLTDANSAGQVAWVQQATVKYTASCNTIACGGNTLYVGGLIGTGSTFGSLPFPAAGPAAYLAAITDTNEALATATPAALATLGLAPNPAHGSTTVQVPAVPGATAATLTLLDVLGRPTRTQTVPTAAAVTLDLVGLAPGIYALCLRAGAIRTTQRLLVE